jgi:mannose-6-phosphate isomerase-like protein (cupin superfamily)
MPTISVIAMTDVEQTNLPGGSWNRMPLTEKTVPEIASSLGYSVFKPGAATGMVKHTVEEFAFVLSGHGEMRTDEGPVPFGPMQALHIPAGLWHAVANTGDEDVVMIFGFPYPAFPPTERR